MAFIVLKTCRILPYFRQNTHNTLRPAVQRTLCRQLESGPRAYDARAPSGGTETTVIDIIVRVVSVSYIVQVYLKMIRFHKKFSVYFLYITSFSACVYIRICVGLCMSVRPYCNAHWTSAGLYWPILHSCIKQFIVAESNCLQ